MSQNEDRLNAFFETMSEELNDVRAADESRRYAISRQVQRARKRARFNDSTLDQKAITNFVTINDGLKGYVCSLDPQVEADARHFIAIVLERFTKTFCEEAIQQPLELTYLYDNWRFGPGASNGVAGTHTADKIYQGMTCTALCEPFVRKLRRSHPYLHQFDLVSGNEGAPIVKGSRLTTVPKNEDTVRTIAIEPSGNMCLQLAAGSYLEGALRKIGLDIRSQQPKNKALACRGSLDGSLATVDLKSASDMISIDLVRKLMPKDWFDLLSCLRSPEIELPSGEHVELNMISTMGNGFTFPLMTLLIVALIYGYRAGKPGTPNLYIDWRDTAVFGDDIIVPVHEYHDICDVLTSAGLVVNHDKSYCEGPFRESCGGDYHVGADVTPFYVKSLASDSDVYIAMNQLVKWCARHKLFLHATSRLLLGFVSGKIHLVPLWCNPNQGLLTIYGPRRYTYLSVVPSRKRLNNDALKMTLAVGGYISESESDTFFSPRVARPKVKVRRARIPQGYRDGYDPAYGSWLLATLASSYIDVMVA